MQIADVKRQVTATIERAKRNAAERRARSDEASREYDALVSDVAIPLLRQIANVLRSRGYAFSVATPGGSARLMSDASDDYIELRLETTGDRPQVLVHTKRARGRRVVETERPIGSGAIRDLTEEELLAAILKELEPFVER